MTRIRVFLIIALCLYLSGCNEDAEPDAAVLIGIWESRGYMAAHDEDWVKTYRFEENGTFQHAITVREPGGEDELGYIFFRHGSFTVSGQTLQLSDVETFASISDPSGSLRSPRDELVQVEMPRIQSREFELLKSNTELLLKGECLTIDCEEIVDELFLRVN